MYIVNATFPSLIENVLSFVPAARPIRLIRPFSLNGNESRMEVKKIIGPCTLLQLIMWYVCHTKPN